VTRVEKETLLALDKLGRKSWHLLHTITNVRLKMRYGAFKHWEGVPWGQRPSMTNGEMAQYTRVTEKWLESFVHRGLVEQEYSAVKAGSKLLMHMGPFWRISKEGQKLAKELG